MFGFIIGTLSLIGLIKVVKHGRGWGRWNHPGARRRWMLRRVFQRLDTTTGQEKVIEEAFEQIESKGQALRAELMSAGPDLAKAFRGEAFDTQAVKERFDKQQAALEELKKAVLAGMQQTHEALRPDQRSLVSEWLEYGPRLHGFGRHHHHGHHRCGPGGRWGGRHDGAPVNL